MGLGRSVDSKFRRLGLRRSNRVGGVGGAGGAGGPSAESSLEYAGPKCRREWCCVGVRKQWR